MGCTRVALAAALLCGVPAALAAAPECPPLAIVSQVDLVAGNGGRAFYVPMEIAGAKKLMLLDTGAAQSVISPQAAAALGLKLLPSKTRLYSLTGSYSDVKAIAAIAIGQLKSGNFNFQLAPANMVEDDPKIAGILGADILGQFDISLDFPKRKLDIISPNHCDGRVVYWPERPLAVVPFERLRSGHIVLPVMLEGKTIKAILDTGASGSTLNRTPAENEFGLELGSAAAPAMGDLNGEKGSTVWRHSFKTLTFEGVTVANPEFVIIPDRAAKHFSDKELGSLISRPGEQVEPDILLGMNVLKHLRVYIAYKEKKLYLSPAAAPAP
jgi:predicted aspartyl protease